MSAVASKPSSTGECMDLLVDCMSNKSGQSYKLRNLLYSLWNGQASASLIEVRGLDAELRLALAVVIMNFGTPGFDYKQIEEPIKKAGLFDWFTDEFDEGLQDFLAKRRTA